jgi:aspartate/methionine/tyrosine aminotransferase
LNDAVREGHNQYLRTFGNPILTNAIAKVYGKKFNRDINPNTEVLVTLGANGSLNAFIMALVNPGEEIVLIEPCFPLYLDHSSLANAVIKTVPMVFKDNTWKVDLDILKSAITDKTKLFIFNNPNNPTGKCFTKEEI